ncbi:EAL domain-containing protein [Hephaestia sp. GCM10023244]|uniref:bifunctional diguanylate cyclase/phosphodiesterase n=1 Tax=unclassified Hephaestia TaxID=2631281 RepID=UPI002076DC6D|nr:bifunctional diguanylate cyclase/phosphodiesterase [Hephaestia sp. MAHUQ-44]MCM8732131.1 bifunctional diguanylate cyclase/phosphodiesterase [Hephaestia sp. MAHUQ-44]
MSEAAAAHAEQAVPLFVLSFRQRDELAASASSAGWRVVAARRGADAERRFLASGAQIALIDARGALDDGLAAARALGDMIAATGNAMLVLVAQTDTAALGEFIDAGATHFLASPHGEDALLQALRCAERHAERVAGSGAGGPRAAPLGWRILPGSTRIEPTPALASLIGSGGAIGWRAALAMLLPGERQAARTKLRQLRQPGDGTAIVHDLAGIGRVVTHLRVAADGSVEAMVEPVTVEAATTTRDAAGARRWLGQRLEDGAHVGAALIALTRFDLVNAAHGRAAGDALLGAAAARIEHVAREVMGRRAIVARVGGAEFLVAADAPHDQLMLLAERVADQLGRAFPIGALTTTVGCRIGVAGRREADDAGALLRRASEALAEAKVSDGATIRDAGVEGAPGAPIEALALDLRHALDRGEIDVLFQPQVAIASARIIGVEALARWRHPRFGELGAETLFAAAERADLAIALSDHVQRLALTRAAGWPAALAQLRLAVNLTAADIARPGFADLFLDRVDTSGFPRQRLSVEITESGLIDDLGAAAALLAALRSAGLRIAIDDFGTGYSSLAYLKALPLDTLKIDKRLSQDITGSARDRIVVRGVIDMARSLGLTVVAEGVETAEQLDLLAKEGCQIYQGFLCAEPLTSEALAVLVAG